MRTTLSNLSTVVHLAKSKFDGGVHLVLFLGILSSAFSQHSNDSLASDSVSLKFSSTDRPYVLFSPSLYAENRWKSLLRNMRLNFWTDFELESGDKRFRFSPLTDLRPDFSSFSYPGLDYRGTSYYVPENVKEYIDYKMGREPYLPVATPVVLGYLLYSLQKYWPGFAAEKSEAIVFNEPEVKLLHILLEQNPLEEHQWYHLYRQRTGDTLFSVSDFRVAREKLIRESLVIQQQMNDGKIHYVPSASAPSFFIRPRP